MQSARLRKFKVWFENSKEYHLLKREIFGEDIYFVELSKKDPVIFDVGAHIGLSTLYFKMLFPKAFVTAIEPNLSNVDILERNLFENKLDDVVVLSAAVGREEGDRDFFVDSSGDEWNSSGSFFERAWNGRQINKKTEVKTIKLSKFLVEPVDLIKLDVEGAEKEVLFEIERKLNFVGKILFEYHPKKEETATDLEELFGRNNFVLKFYEHGREVDWRKTKGLLIGEAVRKNQL